MTERRRGRANHVVIVGGGVDPKEPRQHGLCQHCGERLVIELPVRVDVWAAATRAFVDCHADCRDRRPAVATLHPESHPVVKSEGS